MKDDTLLTETQAETREIFNGTLLHVFKDTVTLPNGNQSTREFIKHNGAVCIVPVTDDGKVIMERQFRYPVNKVIWEIPAGKLDYAEENHLEAAKRELEEETGYVADRWTEIGTYVPAAAYSTECIWMYIAQGLRKGERHLDADEFLNVYEIPLDDLVKQVASGEIADGKTIAAIFRTEKILKNRV